jgi:hypothetical protein
MRAAATMVKPSSKNIFSGWDILVLGAIVLVGLVHLNYPFSGDQALFTIAAAKLSQGGVLYRDFWDLKQPGIYIFYLIGGTLFGFNEVGIHTFELIYLVAFSAILILTTRSYFKHRFISSLVPLLTVGNYYAISDSWHLTQVEFLVGLPLFLTLWFAFKSSRVTRDKTWWLFLSGVMAGLVLLFKFIFLPLIFVFWAIAFLDAIIRQQQPILKSLFGIGIPVILGTLLPLSIVFGYLAQFATLDILSQTFFVYPPRILTEIPGPGINRLISATRWFATKCAPLIFLGTIGIYASLRRPINLLAIYVISWLLLGFAVILLQRQAWWDYYYLLLVVPLGILAAKGLDILWPKIRTIKLFNATWKAVVAAILGIILLFSMPLAALAKRSIFSLKSFSLNREKQLAYQSKLSNAYKTALEEVAFLAKPESLRGDIYICGDPLYYLLSGRQQAIALNGWALEYLLPEQWTSLIAQLDRARPGYIFVSTEYLNLIPKRSLATNDFLQRNYNIFRQSQAGIWYVRKPNLKTSPQP